MEQPLPARRSRPGRSGRALALLAVAALTLTPLACGSDAGTAADADLPQLADGGDATDGDAADAADDGSDGEQMEPAEAALAFAQCMRDNGIPDFPDPEIDGDRIMQLGPESGAVGGPAAEKAQETCAPILEEASAGEAPSPEEQAQMQENMLAFAQCMRDSGFPDFPDPEFDNGRVTQRLSSDMGIDPNDPAFQDTQEKCRPEGAPGPPSVSTSGPGGADPAGGGVTGSGPSSGGSTGGGTTAGGDA